MPALASDIRNAREAVVRILDELGMRAFVYTVEPKEHGWVLSIDCAVDGGWQTAALPVDATELRASLDDASVRDKLRVQWSRIIAPAQSAPLTIAKHARSASRQAENWGSSPVATGSLKPTPRTLLPQTTRASTSRFLVLVRAEAPPPRRRLANAPGAQP
jgi:hypothetical protein